MVPCAMSLPFLIMATLSHSFSATSKTCVEKKMAPPFRQCSAIISFNSCAAMGSSPTNGSSIKMSFGSWISAPITAIFCFMPCEHSEMRFGSAFLISSRSASASMRALRSASDTPYISATKFKYS